MISVCIATYNGEKYIKEQLDSILSQLGTDDEIKISDDGSTDSTIAIVESYCDNRIKIFNHKSKVNYDLRIIRNMNLASQNFTNAISLAAGDIIILSDQDDVWAANKVKVIMEEMQHNNTMVCLHNFAKIDFEGNIINERCFTTMPIRKSIVRNFIRMPFIGCCMAFKKELIKYIVDMPEKTVSHDQFIGLKALCKGFSVRYIDKVLLYRRIHDNNASLYKKAKFNEKLKYNFLLYKSIIFHTI